MWGNPFTHLALKRTKARVQLASRDEAVDAFRKWVLGEAWTDLEVGRREYIQKHLGDLKGKILGCYCVPWACTRRTCRPNLGRKEVDN